MEPTSPETVPKMPQPPLPSTQRMQKTYKNYMFLYGFCYPDHMLNRHQNDAKSHQKSLKLAILGSNVTHVSANLALSWHIWPPTWPQLNPSWRQVGMTSPILGQSSPQLRHPGATLDQTIAKGQFWNKFGTILAQFWDSFGTISAPFGEHLCCFYLHFNNVLYTLLLSFRP